MKRLQNPALTACRGEWPFKENNWMGLGDNMGNSAAFPVIVPKRDAPIGFRWKKALLPNFRKDPADGETQPMGKSTIESE